MHYIMGDLLIARPVDEVFDVVAIASQELAPDPGAVLTYTAVQRPQFLCWTITSSRATTCGTVRFEQAAAGTRVRWCWSVSPKGIWRLIAPLLVRWGERRQERVLSGLEEYVQSTPRESIVGVVPPVPVQVP